MKQIIRSVRQKKVKSERIVCESVHNFLFRKDAADSSWPDTGAFEANFNIVYVMWYNFKIALGRSHFGSKV